MKFEEGQNLRQWIDGLALPPSQSAVDALLAPLLDALTLIHRHDFLHRDIAADNILLRRSGAPVLIDFGSARGEVANQTKTLSALVKPGYSPFEQYASNGRQQGPWTDIYALAATLYLVVTGARPPDAPSRLTEDEYVSALVAAKGPFRPSFLAAIDHALTLAVADRPQSVDAWRADLFAETGAPAAVETIAGIDAATVRATRKIAGEGVTPLAWRKKPQSPGGPGNVFDDAGARGFSKDPDAGAAAGQLAGQSAERLAGHVAQLPVAAGRQIGAFAGGARDMGRAVAGGIAAGGARNGRRIADAAASVRGRIAGIRFPALPARPRLLSLPRLPSRVSVADAIAKRNPFAKRDPARERRSLIKALEEELAKPVVSEDAVAAVDQPAAPRKRWAIWPASRSSVRAAKPSARRMKQTRAPRPRRSAVQRLWWTGGMALRLAAITAFVSAIVLQPDVTSSTAKAPKGAAVAAWSESAENKSPATANALGLVRTLRAHAAPLTSLAVSRDGSRIASISNDGRSVIWHPETGKALQTIDVGAVTVNAIDLAADELVMAQNDGVVTLWDVRTGKRKRRYRRHKGPANAAVFSERAKRFFTAGADERLRVWNTRRGSWRSLRGHEGAVTALAVSRDGRMLVSGGEDRTVKLWNARRRSVIRTHFAHDGPITAVAVAPDGRAFASGSRDESIRLYPAGSDGEIRVLYGHASAITALSFSPNGRLLASASADHAVKLWDATTGALLHTFIGHTDAVKALAFLPDGRRLVTAGADKTVRIWEAQVAGF
ncbi:MAG: WD40 repeat domain-containing serine/threonine-protein kinase [Pseudomonadota bacterium]